MIDLDDETIDALRAHLGKQFLGRMELEGSYEDNGLVFPGPLGEPLNPMAVTRGFQSFAKRMGFNEGKVHNLRHFARQCYAPKRPEFTAGQQTARPRQCKHHR